MGCGISRGPANGSGDAATQARAMLSVVEPHVDRVFKSKTRQAPLSFDADVRNEAGTTDVAHGRRARVVASREMAAALSSNRTSSEMTESGVDDTSNGITASFSRPKTTSQLMTTKTVIRPSQNTSSSSITADDQNHRTEPLKGQTATLAHVASKRVPGVSKMASGEHKRFTSGSKTVTEETTASSVAQSSNSTASSLNSSFYSRSEREVSTALITSAASSATGLSDAKSSSSYSSDASSRIKTATENATVLEDLPSHKASLNAERATTVTTSLSKASDNSSSCEKDMEDRAAAARSSLHSGGEGRDLSSKLSGSTTTTSADFDRAPSSRSPGTLSSLSKTSQEVSISAQSRLDKIPSTSARSSNIETLSSKTSETFSRLTMASEEGTKLDASLNLPATSSRVQMVSEDKSTSAQSVVKRVSPKTPATSNLLKANEESETTSEKSRFAIMSKSTNPNEKTESFSKASCTATRGGSTKSKDEGNLSKSQLSKDTLISCHLSDLIKNTKSDGVSTATSGSKYTLVQSMQSSYKNRPEAALKEVADPSEKAISSSVLLKKTSEKEQSVIADTPTAADSSSDSNDGAASVCDNTSAPTCTASLWERSATSSEPSALLVKRVEFYNCNDAPDQIDVADDREDFYFRPASWCRSDSAVDTKRYASPTVVLHVRRAGQTAMSADEAYLQYWVSSCTLAAPSDSETLLSDDDGCGRGDGSESEKNRRSSSTNIDASTGCDEATSESNNVDIGDTPCSTSTENYSGDVKVRHNDGVSKTAMKENIDSFTSQQPESVTVQSNVNNSAVVGSLMPDTWELVSDACASRLSWSVSGSGALLPQPTSSCHVLDSIRVHAGQLQVESNLIKEHDPEIWQLPCQEVIEEYVLGRGVLENLDGSSEVGLSGALSNEVDLSGVVNNSEPRVRNPRCDMPCDKYDRPTTQNMKKISDVENKSTVARSWCYVEQAGRVEKMKTLTHKFIDKKEVLPKLLTALKHGGNESRRLPLKPLPPSYQSGVIAWQQRMHELTGDVITGITTTKERQLLKVSRTNDYADEIGTDEINDADADSGCASRFAVPQQKGGRMREASSLPLDRLLEKALTVAAKQHYMYKPEVAYEKSENLNSIDDDDISESVSAIEYHEYDVMTSYELENPNSIDDSTNCVSPSTKSPVPVPSLEEINTAANIEISNSYTPLVLCRTGEVSGAPYSDQRKDATTDARDDACVPNRPTAPLNINKCTTRTVPVGPLKVRNDGSIAELNNWWHSNSDRKTTPVDSHTTRLSYHSSSGAELPQHSPDIVPIIYATSPTRGDDKLIETCLNATIELEITHIRSKNDTAHEQRLQSPMAQKYGGLTEMHDQTTSTVSNTFIHTLTPSQRDRSPGCCLSPQEAESSKESTSLQNKTKSTQKLECGTPQHDSSQASTSMVSPSRSSPSGDKRPSSGRSTEIRGSPLPTRQLQEERVPSRSSTVLQNMIHELTELQMKLRTRITAAEVARAHVSYSSANPTAGLVTEMEAADLAEAMASANALAEKLQSLVRQKSLQGIVTGAECARGIVNVTTTTTTDVAVSVDKRSRHARPYYGRSPPAPSRGYTA